MRVLFVHTGLTRFIRLDRDLLASRFEVSDWVQAGRWVDLPGLTRAVGESDVVFGWFASWHTFWPSVVAALRGRPTVLVIGGYDVSRMPEIGYGNQRDLIRRVASRLAIRNATALTAVSEASIEEIRLNLGRVADRVRLIYHGVPDPFHALPPQPAEPMVMTVAAVNRTTMELKGTRVFVEAARLLPGVQFVVAGVVGDDDQTRAMVAGAAANVTFTGQLQPEDLDRLYAKARVYVQASLHESFGMSVAEAMLAGCVPVVNPIGALPEVTGRLAVNLRRRDAEGVAEAVTVALGKPADARGLGRERILDLFPVSSRQEALTGLVAEAALAGRARVT